MNVKGTVLEVLYATLPITILVLILQAFAGKLPTEMLVSFIAGSVMVMLGLTLFFIGAKIGFLPVGETIGAKIVEKGKLWLILLVSFAMGFAVTVAEPDLQVLASQVSQVSGGAIGRGILIAAVAVGVGVFVTLAVLRVFLNIPIIYLLAAGYALVFAISAFTPAEYLAVAFDSGGVTTGPMTVPFILALGVGVAMVARRRNTADENDFGLVGLASIGPILAVLLLGVFF
ncbi:MAG: DUF1538 domain-containing protein [Patescibacteria group bacterium]